MLGEMQNGPAAADLDDEMLPFVRGNPPPEVELPVHRTRTCLLTVDIGSIYTGYVVSEVKGQYNPADPLPGIDALRRIRDGLRTQRFGSAPTASWRRSQGSQLRRH